MRKLTPAQAARFQATTDRFNNMIKQHGWAVHHVADDEDHMNFHTHGVAENLKHPDFQITMPIDPRAAHSLTTMVIDRIKAGQVFEEDKPYLGFMKDGYPISFKKCWECGREVMRILICDENQKLPGEEGCNPVFAKQLDVLEAPGEFAHKQWIEKIVELIESEMLAGKSFNGTVSYIRIVHDSDELARGWPAWATQFEDEDVPADDAAVEKFIQMATESLKEPLPPEASPEEKRAYEIGDIVANFEYNMLDGMSFDEAVTDMRQDFAEGTLDKVRPVHAKE